MLQQPLMSGSDRTSELEPEPELLLASQETAENEDEFSEELKACKCCGRFITQLALLLCIYPACALILVMYCLQRVQEKNMSPFYSVMGCAGVCALMLGFTLLSVDTNDSERANAKPFFKCREGKFAVAFGIASGSCAIGFKIEGSGKGWASLSILFAFMVINVIRVRLRRKRLERQDFLKWIQGDDLQTLPIGTWILVDDPDQNDLYGVYEGRVESQDQDVSHLTSPAARNRTNGVVDSDDLHKITVLREFCLKGPIEGKSEEMFLLESQFLRNEGKDRLQERGGKKGIVWKAMYPAHEPRMFNAGAHEDVYCDIFERYLWALQGAAVFGLAFRFYFGAAIYAVRQGVPWLTAILSFFGFDIISFGSNDATSASSEVLYPVLVYVFLAVLRSYEKASGERENLLHEKDDLALEACTTLNTQLFNTGDGKGAMNKLIKKVSTCICCGCRKSASGKGCCIRRARRLHLLRLQKIAMVDDATYSLDLTRARLDAETQPHRSSEQKQHRGSEQKQKESTDWLRLQELECTLLEKFSWAPFDETRSNKYDKSMRSIGTRKAFVAGRKKYMHKENLQQRESNVQQEKDRARARVAASGQAVIVAIQRHRWQRVKCVDECGNDLQGNFDELLSKTNQQSKNDQFLRASDLVRLIVLMSKADQIALHRIAWWVVVFTSLFHATLPVLWSMREACAVQVNSSDPGISYEAQCTHADLQPTIELRQSVCSAQPHCEFHGSFDTWHHLIKMTKGGEGSWDDDGMQCESSWASGPNCRGTILMSVNAWIMMLLLLLAVTYTIQRQAAKRTEDTKDTQDTEWNRKKKGIVFVGFLTMAGVFLQTLWMHWIWEPDLHVVVTAHLILLVVLIAAAIFCELAKKRKRARACGLLAVWAAVIAVVGVFGDSAQHTVGFLLSYWLSFSVTIRMSKCLEDVYEKYRRMVRAHFHDTGRDVFVARLMIGMFACHTMRVVVLSAHDTLEHHEEQTQYQSFWFTSRI
jgi:hypothetical protein